jgi:superfamily II DNA or RNA helicase
MGAACRISVGPVWAKLYAPADVLAAATRDMSLLDPKNKYSAAVKRHVWDGKVKFVVPGPSGTVRFRSGLTWRIATFLKQKGNTVAIEWPEAKRGAPYASAVAGMEWRDHQSDANAKNLRARRIVIQCATRGGKTEIGIEFVRALGLKTLWITHLTTLMKQTPGRFMERIGVECGIVQGKKRTDGQVVVGMVQTLARMAKPTIRVSGSRARRPNPNYDPDFFKQFDAVIVDEAHHGSADTWMAVLDACVNAAWRLGLSGTVDEEIVRISEVNIMKIESILGPTYRVATTSELADLGFVATPHMRLLKCKPSSYSKYEDLREELFPNWREDPRKILGNAGARIYNEAYRLDVMENQERNLKIAATARQHAMMGDKFLVLCNRVDHAKTLAGYLDPVGMSQFPIRVLSGDDPADWREGILNEFKLFRGGFVLVCTPFFREGVDVPQIDAGFLAGAGESDTATLQALARMLTARAGKGEVAIYDFDDSRPGMHEKDYVGQHAAYSRIPLYERSGFKITRS